jgi:hypothetical protein
MPGGAFPLITAVLLQQACSFELQCYSHLAGQALALQLRQALLQAGDVNILSHLGLDLT